MLKWVFGVDSGPFRRGLNDMKKQASGFGRSLKGIFGALGIGVGIHQLRSFAQEMDRVHKLSKRFGTTSEVIQKLGVVAETSGASMEQLFKGLTQATKAGVDAQNGLVTYKRAFDDLNISVAEFNGADEEKKLVMLQKGFRSAKTEAEGMAAVMAILGTRGGAELLPMIRSGEDLDEQFKKINVVSSETTAKIAKFNDTMTIWGQNLKAFAGTVIEAFEDVGRVMGKHGENLARSFKNGKILNPLELLQSLKDARQGVIEDKANRLNKAAEAAGPATVAPKVGVPDLLKNNPSVQSDNEERRQESFTGILGMVEKTKKAAADRMERDRNATAEAKERAREAAEDRKRFFQDKDRRLRGELASVPEASVAVSEIQAAGGGDAGSGVFTNAKQLEQRKVGLLEAIEANTRMMGPGLPGLGGGPLEPRG